MKKILLSFFIGVMLIACNQKTVSVREVWTKEQANEWYKQWGWLRGCDFIPVSYTHLGVKIERLFGINDSLKKK